MNKKARGARRHHDTGGLGRNSDGITWFDSEHSSPERLLLIEQAIYEFGHLLPYGWTPAPRFAKMILKNQGLNAPVHILAALSNLRG